MCVCIDIYRCEAASFLREKVQCHCSVLETFVCHDSFFLVVFSVNPAFMLSEIFVLSNVASLVRGLRC